MSAAPRLMFVADIPACRGSAVARALDAARGGVDAVQVRGARTDREAFDVAAELVRALPSGARVIVNGRFDIALAAGAAGVHLRDEGLPASAVRAAARTAGAPATFLVGQSVHGAEGLQEAAAAGADYAVLGPVGDAHGKAGRGRAWAEEQIARARDRGPLPPAVLLIGGLGPDDAPWIASLGRAGETMGLAAIRCFADAGPGAQEVAARAAAGLASRPAATI